MVVDSDAEISADAAMVAASVVVDADADISADSAIGAASVI